MLAWKYHSFIHLFDDTICKKMLQRYWAVKLWQCFTQSFIGHLMQLLLFIYLFFWLCNCYTHEVLLIHNFVCTLFPCTRWFQGGYACAQLGVWSTWIYCFAFIQAWWRNQAPVAQSMDGANLWVIVNTREWLWNSANFKGAYKGAHFDVE